jgi:hypothetical protein
MKSRARSTSPYAIKFAEYLKLANFKIYKGPPTLLATTHQQPPGSSR